jgi:CBS domain-containing protein
MLQLRDIMTTDVATIHPEMTLREAVELLASRHISGAPVVANGKVLGVISVSDLLAFVAAPPEDEAAPVDDEAAAVEDEAWRESLDWDERDEPSSRHLAELWERSGGTAPAEPTEARRQSDLLREHTVAEAMTPRIFSLPPTADVSAAAEYMQVAEMHRVFVMEHGHLAGIVTTSDIARAVAEQRITRRVYCFGEQGEE